MKKTLLDEMIDRFLSWKLPKNFNPDCGISFNREVNISPIDDEWKTVDRYDAGPGHWPVGTNLLDATQAKEMIMHVLGISDANKSAGWLVECSNDKWQDFFFRKDFAEMKAAEMRAEGFEDVKITEIFRKDC